jgi:hypothetical protein
LSDDAVGEFLGDHFEATHQKVGTFVVAANGQKQGGNVASYFCLSDGTVIHAVAGPVDAGQFLREAKWAAEVRKLAVTEAGGEASKYRGTIRKAHAERLAIEHGVPISMNALPKIATGAPPEPSRNALRSQTARRVGTQGQVHLLLAQAPLPKLSQLYPIIFEGILKERLSALPVQTR